MQKSRSVAISVLALMCGVGMVTGCARPFTVTHLDDEGISKLENAPSVVYSLPRAHAKLSVVVSRKKHAPGICRFTKLEPEQLSVLQKAGVADPARHIERFGEANEPVYEYDLSSASVEIVAVPDPEQTYAVAFARRVGQKSATSFSFSEQGVLTEASSDAESKAVEITFEAFDAVLAVVAAIVKKSAPDEDPCQEELAALELDVGARDGLGKNIHDLATTNSKAEGAKKHEPAERVAHPDAWATYLDGTINRRVKRILGTSGQEEKTTVVCEVDIPNDCTDGTACTGMPSVAVSPKGIVAQHGACIAPKSWMGTTTAKDEDVFQVGVALERKHGDMVASVKATSEETESGEGLAYRVPGVGILSLYRDDDLLRSDTVLIPQFGVVARLPGRGNDLPTKATVDMALHPSTGALKKVSVVFGTADLGRLSDVGGAAAGVVSSGVEAAKPTNEFEKAKAQKCLELLAATGVIPDGC